MARETDTKERLLEAAIEAITAGGEQSLRVDQIVKQVGVTKPSLYYFFGDREGLVVAALAEMYRRALSVGSDLILAAVKDARTAEEFMAAFASTQGHLTSAEAAQRRAMMASVRGGAVSRPKLQEALREVHREIAQMHRQFVELGRERGVIHLPFDLRVASLFTVTVFSNRYMAEMHDDIDKDEWDALVFEVFRHLLFDHVERQGS